MNLYQIQYFITVAESLSYTKAAQQLHISQPSVSRQIALLEQELGYKLLIRNNKMVKLTPEGDFLYKDFCSINKQINDVLEKAKQSKLGIEGKLTIGCIGELNTKLFLPEYVKQFNTNYPRIEICLERYSFKELRHGLINGNIDIVFTLSFAFSPENNMKCFSVIDTDTYFALPLTHPLANKEDLSLSDLLNDPIIVLSREDCPEVMSHVFDIFDSYGLKPTNIMETPSFETAYLYLESGIGYTFVDPSLTIFGSKKLKFIKLAGESSNTKINAIWRADNTNAALNLFTKLFVDCRDLKFDE